ncbi:hypothetical protein RKD45_006237 [Streptomyces griseus]|nr:hypothetical protein [Streptomyces pratensis]
MGHTGVLGEWVRQATSGAPVSCSIVLDGHG